MNLLICPLKSPRQDGRKCRNRVPKRHHGRYSSFEATLRIFFYVQHLANIDQWESIWAVSMRGSVLCYKYAAIQMAKQNSGGRIIGKKATSVMGSN
jgi:NAD(P)-dependent dehydrogenase (short-subunit alcohol dehydrogenase family)